MNSYNNNKLAKYIKKNLADPTNLIYIKKIKHYTCIVNKTSIHRFKGDAFINHLKTLGIHSLQIQLFRQASFWLVW